MGPFEIFMEIFGYVGTALVIISMLMTSVRKLRIFNICGSAISMTYSIVVTAWPVAILNASLIVINVIQLIRMHSTRVVFSRVRASAEDATLLHFLRVYGEDIKKYFSAYTVCGYTGEIDLVFCKSEVVGIVAGHREGDVFNIDIDYAIPKFRDFSVSKFLYSELKGEGIKTLVASDSREYLKKMGFVPQGKNAGDAMVKTL